MNPPENSQMDTSGNAGGDAGRGIGGDGGGRRAWPRCGNCDMSHDPAVPCWPLCQRCQSRHHPRGGCAPRIYELEQEVRTLREQQPQLQQQRPQQQQQYQPWGGYNPYGYVAPPAYQPPPDPHNHYHPAYPSQPSYYQPRPQNPGWGYAPNQGMPPMQPPPPPYGGGSFAVPQGTAYGPNHHGSGSTRPGWAPNMGVQTGRGRGGRRGRGSARRTDKKREEKKDEAKKEAGKKEETPALLGPARGGVKKSKSAKKRASKARAKAEKAAKEAEEAGSNTAPGSSTMMEGVENTAPADVQNNTGVPPSEGRAESPDGETVFANTQTASLPLRPAPLPPQNVVSVDSLDEAFWEDARNTVLPEDTVLDYDLYEGGP